MSETNLNQPILEDLRPAQNDRAVVIIGRFQPPTIGHYKIINLAKKFIRENKDLSLFTKPVIVIIDGKKSSKNKKENPLTVDEREYYMKHSGRANGVLFLSAANAYDGFNAVREAGFEPIVVGAGSDRAKGYIDLLDDKFVDRNGKKQKHYELPGLATRHQVNDPHKITSEPDVSKVSGSLARHAAALGYFDEFVTITGLEKNIPAAKKLFKQIKSQIGEQ